MTTEPSFAERLSGFSPRFARFAASAVALLAGFSGHAMGATFIWDGTTNTWPSVHWLDSGSVLVAGGLGAAITDTYTINGGTVLFTDHDTFGAAAANPLLTINVNGGILSNEAAAFGQAFTTLGLVNLAGGTITSTGGALAGYQAFQFKNTVTSSGASFINTTSTPANFNGFHVTNNTFNVTDGTLTVTAPLLNAAGGAQAGFTKTGAGTMVLGAVNGFTGSTLVTGGTLDISASGSAIGLSKINTQSGGAITISGAVSTAANGNFSIGGGLTGTTGFVTVNNGGVLTIGTGTGGTVGFTGVGGSDAGSGGQKGKGTLTINTGGTVNVAAGGTGAGGLDGSSLWINPYGQTGTSTINLDGGTLSTARPVQDGSGGGAAVFNFNGGTLQAAGAVNLISATSNVRNGGAVVHTNGLNASMSAVLVHSAVPGDAAIDGGLTKTGAGNLTVSGAGSTYTGNVLISQGTLTTTGGSNVAIPAATVLGNMTTPGKTVTVSSGAGLTFGGNDPVGSTTSTPVATIIVNGGTLSHSTFFATLGNVTLNDGATMTGADGVSAGFQTWNLRGSVTVGGTGGAVISTSGTTNTGIHLGIAGTNDFIVNATGAAVDLSVNVPLLDRPLNNAGAGSLRKLGAGRMVLTAASTYTGATLVNGGTLEVNGGSISGPGLIDVGSAGNAANFTLTTGSVTAGGQFVIGAHGSTGTAAVNGGTLQVNGTLYAGGYGEGTGTGTVTQTAGTVTATGGVDFGGGGPNNGVYNLSGGTLTAANLRKNGSGTATFNFNGGTLRPTASSATFLQGFTEANVLSGGAVVDTNAFDITVAQALQHGAALGAAVDGGLTKNGNGVLTLSNAASSFTGNLAINGGTVVAGAAGAGTTSTLGAASVARSVTVAAGATLQFNSHDTLGNDATVTPVGVVINAGGLVKSNSTYTTLPTLTLNGGELRAAGGAASAFPAFQLRSVTVGGPTASQITATGAAFSSIALGQTGGDVATFNVADVTGDAAPDLSISAVLQNSARGSLTSGLAKSGAGTLTLTAANVFSGPTLVSAGVLEVGGSGALVNSNAVSVSGGTLLLSGANPVDRINNAAAVAIGGGSAASKLAVAGTVTESLGALTLVSGSGVRVIDFGNAASLLTFASIASDASTTALKIWNWSGTTVTGGGVDQLLITSGLLGANLVPGDITFYSDAGNTAYTLPTGWTGAGGNELAPIPEAGSVLTALLLLGSAGWRERRKFTRTRSAA